jgi:hypothetical protein
LKIDSLKDLEKLAKLCRKVGINTIKVGEIEFHLGVEPYKAQKEDDSFVTDPLARASIPMPNIEYNDPEPDKIASPDELTEEQLMHYSSRPEAFEDSVKQ